jgi:hypothetical protein
VFWIPGYPGPPAPGPFQRPNFGPGGERRPKLSREDPHEEAPHEENDGTTAKYQKTSSRVVPHEGKDHIHVSSARFRAEQEDKGRRPRTIHATVGDIPNRYTSDVVLIQQARVAHQGWYDGFAIPGGPVAKVATAVLDAGAYGRSEDRPMADC